MNIGDAQVGSRVVYTPRKEDGVVTSINSTYVFVRYGGDTNSKATNPGDLELMTPEGF
jgi:hypothetical protein